MALEAVTSRLRVVVALLALLSLVALAAVFVVPGDLRCPAVVEAAQTFSLESIAPGRFSWTVHDGTPPRGQAPVRERFIQFERSDLVEMELEPWLENGAQINRGQTVAVVRSLRNQRVLNELRAQRVALEAQRSLLVAGGPPEAVVAAERNVEVAQAELETALAELVRLRLLEAKGLASSADLEVAELESQVGLLEVELARAAVAVARRPARPEALRELDARIASVDGGIEELATLLGEERVTCPIKGVAEVGAGGSQLKVYELDPAYLEVPLPAGKRHKVQVGTAVLFTTVACPNVVFEGEVVDLANSMDTLQGQAVIWVSVSVANPDGLLSSGMAGTALVSVRGDRFGPATSLRRRLGGRWL